MEFDAAIFDLDGTLVDTLEDIADAMNRVLRERSYPVHDTASYKLMIGRGLGNLVAETLPPEARTEATIAACLEQMMAEYRGHCLDKTHLYDGIAELTSALRAAGVGLAVLSNKADELTQRIVGALFAAGTFAVIVGARPDLPFKPDPTAALLVAQRLGVPPARIACLGDSGSDMRTAAAAGMPAVGVSWGFRGRESCSPAEPSRCSTIPSSCSRSVAEAARGGRMDPRRGPAQRRSGFRTPRPVVG